MCVRILRNLRGNVNIIDINKSLFKSEWLIIFFCTIILWESAGYVCTCILLSPAEQNVNSLSLLSARILPLYPGLFILS